MVWYHYIANLTLPAPASVVEAINVNGYRAYRLIATAAVPLYLSLFHFVTLTLPQFTNSHDRVK